MTTLSRDFDAIADHYDEHFTRPIDRAENHAIYRTLAPHINDRYVLDVGCGTGALLDHLNPSHYHGIDLSPRMLAEARRKHPGRHFRQADACNGNFHPPANSFDTAISLRTLSYLNHPSVTLTRMTRALRPGGTLIVHGFTSRYLTHASHLPPTRLIRPVTDTSLRRMLRRAGLTNVTTRGFRRTTDHRWMNRLPVPVLAAWFDFESRAANPDRCLTIFATGHRGQ